MLLKTELWDASITLVNENINIPRKSMRGVVILFAKTTTDSEEYVYPNISEVKITIKGVPNSVYSQRIKKSRFFRMIDKDQFMTVEKLYKDKFALVINLRSNPETAAGKKIVNTQNEVLLETKKTATTRNIKYCTIFLLLQMVW